MMDDAKLVTAKWLESVGFVHDQPSVSYPRKRCGAFDSIRVDVTFEGRWRKPTLWVLDEEVKVGKVTRGDVRRLCAALGSPLESK